MRGNLLEDNGGDGIMIAVTDGALIEHDVVAHANQRSEGYNNIAIWSERRQHHHPVQPSLWHEQGGKTNHSEIQSHKY